MDHRLNPFHAVPVLLDNNNPSVGLTNTNSASSNGWLSCTFTRKKSNSNYTNYFDLSNQFYILAATGTYTSSRITTGFTGTLNLHTSKYISSNPVNFDSFNITSGATGVNIYLEKSHGLV